MPGERGAKAPRVNLANISHWGLLRLEKHTGGLSPPRSPGLFSIISHILSY
jgi:hypothetical protein